jgi:uroporphyrinogen-III synthase
VAVTSANALQAVASHARFAELQSLPLYVVGRRSAEAARAIGFASVASADGNQQDLARLIRTHLHGDAPLLYLAGEDRSGDLAAELPGIAVATVVVYRAVLAAELPAPVRDALASGRLEGVLHFSKRSAEAFVRCARAGGLLDAALKASHYCLSEQVAEPLAAAGVRGDRLHVAARPDEATLIAVIR